MVDAMKWPEKHTCHNGMMRVAKGEWRAPEVRARGEGAKDFYPRIYPFRTCDFCGSIHPEDLFVLMRDHASVALDEADWKYGWPHKFYIEGIPNPLVGVMTVTSARYTRDEDGNEKVELGPATPERPTIGHKFYNEHLSDEGFDDEARNALIQALWQRTGILFSMTERGIAYRRMPFSAENAS
jgi:hypothetical protein